MGVLLLALFYTPAEVEHDFNTISGAEAYEALANDDSIILIDVRTIEEHEDVRIPNSIPLPFNELEETIVMLVPNRSYKIFVYCQRGIRSQDASQILVDLGYTNVYNIGGIIDWPGALEE